MADDSEANADPSEPDEDEQSPPAEDREADDGEQSSAGDDVSVYAPDPSVLTDESGSTADESADDAAPVDEADAESGGTESDDDSAVHDADAEAADVPDPAADPASGDGSPDAAPETAGADSSAETVRAIEEAYDLDPVEDESLVDDAAGQEAATDGAAPVGDEATEFDDDGFLDDGLVGEGPEEDREMPLADHIEEMVRRLAVVLVIGGGITLLLYPGADVANYAFGADLLAASDVIQFLWNAHIPGAPEIADRRPRLYGPLELILTEIKVAGLAGFVLSLPIFVYETYRFMRPGLYPNERRYYLAAVPTSLVLALVGVAFAHFVVLPAIFAYFTSYTQGTAVIAFGLRETFNLILILMGYMAIVFQIPLFIMLGIMMGLFTRVWLTEKRLLFWGGFLGLAFLVSPDPTGMAPIIVAATMISLFEGTLALLKWTGN
jgi:sec-independent protein translocase protein TatC